ENQGESHRQSRRKRQGPCEPTSVSKCSPAPCQDDLPLRRLPQARHGSILRRDEELDLLFLWRLERGSGVPADVIACRASEFREACDSVNTLAYVVANEGVRIDG